MIRRQWKKLVIVGLALVIALAGFGACAESKRNNETGTEKLDIGISFPEDDWRAAYIQDFAAEIESASNGEIKAQIHYMDEYPDMMDLLNEMNRDSGKLDIILVANPYLGDSSIPDFYVSGLPYMFQDFEDAWEFAESDVNTKIEDQLPQYGMRILSHYCGGFRNIGAIHPIEKPEDLEGLVVATVKSPLLMDMLSALGAVPQPAIASELNDALKKGVYTGFEVTLPTFLRDGDYQYLPYVAVTNHAYNLWSLIINEKSWQNLSEDNQKIIKEAAEKYAALEREESKSNFEETLEKLESAGATITWPDYELFKEATEEVRQRHSSNFSDTYQEAMDYLEDRD